MSPRRWALTLQYRPSQALCQALWPSRYNTDPARLCARLCDSDVCIRLDHHSSTSWRQFRLASTLGWLQERVWVHWGQLLARPWENAPANQLTALPTEGGGAAGRVKPLVLSRVLDLHGYRLRVEVQQEGSNLWFSAEYWIFTVGDEASEYRLYVDGYSGDASPEWLASVHSGMNFTTYDQDNDLDYFSNCAVAWDGGWWHNVCFKICLTCGWSSHFWASLPNGEVIDASRMMIQPQPVWSSELELEAGLSSLDLWPPADLTWPDPTRPCHWTLWNSNT